MKTRSILGSLLAASIFAALPTAARAGEIAVSPPTKTVSSSVLGSPSSIEPVSGPIRCRFCDPPMPLTVSIPPVSFDAYTYISMASPNLATVLNTVNVAPHIGGDVRGGASMSPIGTSSPGLGASAHADLFANLTPSFGFSAFVDGSASYNRASACYSAQVTVEDFNGAMSSPVNTGCVADPLTANNQLAFFSRSGNLPPAGAWGVTVNFDYVVDAAAIWSYGLNPTGASFTVEGRAYSRLDGWASSSNPSIDFTVYPTGYAGQDIVYADAYVGPQNVNGTTQMCANYLAGIGTQGNGLNAVLEASGGATLASPIGSGNIFSYPVNNAGISVGAGAKQTLAAPACTAMPW
jgi:hypothetical protein